MSTHTHYLIVGSSHAALEAITAIRMMDPEGSLTLASKDKQLPYSPTVLPYVVSGQSSPERVALRNDAFFTENRITYQPGDALTHLDTTAKQAQFASGKTVSYDKLLLATGAAPVVPPIPGIDTVTYHVLRSLDDALGLREAIKSAKRAVILGAGLVGMHAAENIAKAGVPVTVVEMNPQVLGGYFDADASARIEQAFRDNGADVRTRSKVVKLAPRGTGASVTLDSGEVIDGDLLLVATGVRPELGYLNGSPVERDQGILVDDTMATSQADVWAAGDVAQARNFYGDSKTVNAILPTAVDQGRIAGMAMAGDSALKAYPGGVPLNTYHFFGRHAISVGVSQAPAGAEVPAGIEVIDRSDAGRYLKIVLQDNRLLGIFGIDVFFDGGIMWQLILRRTDLSGVKDAFLADPMAVGRALMSTTWR